MRIPLTFIAVVALVALAIRPALAEPDELMSCKILSVKADKIDPSSGNLKFVCKAPPSGFPVPHGRSSPLGNDFGASLLIRDLGSNLYLIPGSVLPQGGWTGIGNPPGSRGFRFKDPLKHTPCRVITVSTKQVSGTCRAHMGPSNLPVVGDVGLTLFFGGNPEDQMTYCAQFGGTTVRNDAAVFLRKNAPAPVSCPPLP